MINFKDLKGHQWASIGIGVLIVVAVITVETRSIVGALHENDGFAGISWAMISGIFALLAVVSFAVAGSLKEDYRGHVRARAFPARVLAIALAIVPASFFGSAVKADNMQDEWLAYSTPAMAGHPSSYQLDLDVVEDPQSDVMERNAARWRIQEKTPGSIALSVLDFEFWMAIFFQAILLFGADVLRIPAPMTKAEFEHLKRSAAAKQGAETRRRRAAEKKAAEKKKAGGLKIFAGGRKD